MHDTSVYNHMKNLHFSMHFHLKMHAIRLKPGLHLNFLSPQTTFTYTSFFTTYEDSTPDETTLLLPLDLATAEELLDFGIEELLLILLLAATVDVPITPFLTKNCRQAFWWFLSREQTIPYTNVIALIGKKNPNAMRVPSGATLAGLRFSQHDESAKQAFPEKLIRIPISQASYS